MQRLLHLRHRECAEMEHAGCKQTGSASVCACDEMIECSHSAGCNNRQADRLADCLQKIGVETLPRSVAIHAGEQDLACAERFQLLAPGNSVQAGRSTAAMSEDFPSAWLRQTGVDGGDNALAAEFAGSFGDQLGTCDRG